MPQWRKDLDLDAFGAECRAIERALKEQQNEVRKARFCSHKA